MSAPALARVSPACAAAAVAALDRAHPGVAAALPPWLWPAAWSPGPGASGSGASGIGASGIGTGAGGPGSAGAGDVDAPPPLAAALAVAVGAPVSVDVAVLDGAARLRGRWSLGAGPAATFVLGADPAGAPRVEVGLVATAGVVEGVARLLPPGTQRRTGTERSTARRPAGVAAADLLASSVLDPAGAHRLLSDVARARGAAAADALQRCAAGGTRLDLDVRAGGTTWCATWLVGPPWLRIDPGPEPGQVVAVPSGRRDVLDVLAVTLRTAVLAGARRAGDRR